MKILISVILMYFLVSCSQMPMTNRTIASNNCYESIKAEYNSYFDSYEKCRDNQPIK
jgi:hypothetical protein